MSRYRTLTIFSFIALLSVIPHLDFGEATTLTLRAPILIDGNGDFTLNGSGLGCACVANGTGSPIDPFIIEGWEINASLATGIHIRNTDSHFVVRDVYVHSGAGSYDGIVLVNTTNGSIVNATSSNNSIGIKLFSSMDVTIRRSDVSQNQYGIYLGSSANVTVAGGNVSSNERAGIYLLSATNITIAGGNVFDNGIGVSLHQFSANVTVVSTNISDNGDGISIDSSVNVTVTGNTFFNDGVSLQGTTLSHFNSHVIQTNNMVNGLPLRYYKDCADVEVDALPSGQLLVVNCTGFIAKNLTIANTSIGIGMAYVDGATVTASNLSNNGAGLFIWYTTNVTLAYNIISSTDGSRYGIFLWSSTNVSVHHNQLIANDPQAFDTEATENIWDDGYPAGGNSWSDYAGIDACSGPSQDVCPDPDGIGDTPYIIDADSRDNYPRLPTGTGAFPPSISITSPMEGAVSNTRQIAVSGVAREAGVSGLARVDVRVNGGPWVTALGTDSWSITIELGSGDNIIEAQAWDIEGNASLVPNVTVTYDAKPAIVHAPHGEVTVGETVLITATVTDDTGAGNVYLHYQAVDAATFIDVRMTRTTGDTYEATIPAQPASGTVRYYLNVTDGAGNGARNPSTGEHTFLVRGRTAVFPAELFLIILVLVVASVGTFFLTFRRKRKGRVHDDEKRLPDG